MYANRKLIMNSHVSQDSLVLQICIYCKTWSIHHLSYVDLLDDALHIVGQLQVTETEEAIQNVYTGRLVDI